MKVWFPLFPVMFVFSLYWNFLYWFWLIVVSADLQQWRLMCLAAGFVFLLLASIVSSWVPFYYSTSMAIGVFLVIIFLLFQVHKFGFVVFRSSSPFLQCFSLFSLCQCWYHQIGFKCITQKQFSIKILEHDVIYLKLWLRFQMCQNVPGWVVDK